MNPIADIVAVAIVEACAATGEDAVLVASGGGYRAGGVSRSRFYAGMALQQEFPEWSTAMICRMIGYRAYSSFTSNAMRFRSTRGYDSAILNLVAAAVSRAKSLPTADATPPEAPPAPLPRPMLPGKSKLHEMLRKAVENTAKLQGGQE